MYNVHKCVAVIIITIINTDIAKKQKNYFIHCFIITYTNTIKFLEQGQPEELNFENALNIFPPNSMCFHIINSL